MQGTPRRHNRLLVTCGRLALQLSRWRIVGSLPELPKFVIIVAPHTSNWDFPIGVAAMFALDLVIHWFGKDSIFFPPAGWLLRKLGGRPIRRDAPEGVVAEVAAIVRSESQFLLALAPEGTRKRVDAWRTGFYRIAEAAAVPIVPVWFDYARREIGIGAPMRATGDLEHDIDLLQLHYSADMARHPKNYGQGRGTPHK